MTRTILGLLTIVLMAGCANSAPYVAVGAGVGDFEPIIPTNSYTDVNLGARIGYNLGNYFGIEAEGVVNVGGAANTSSTNQSFTTERSDTVDSHLGLFIRGRLPVSDRVGIFARTGLGSRRTTTEIRSIDLDEADEFEAGQEVSFRQTDLFTAFGVGIEFEITADNKNAVRAEFTQYGVPDLGGDEDNDTRNDSVFSLAYVRKF